MHVINSLGAIKNTTALTTYFELVSSQTASSSSALNFTGLTAYQSYLFILNFLKPATDNVSLWLQTSTNNGSSYDAGASDYSFARWDITAGGASGSGSSATASAIGLANLQGNNTNEFCNGEVRLHNPTASNYGSITWQVGGNRTDGTLTAHYGSGQRLAAADVDAIRFLYSSGNIASGNIQCYGLRI